MNTPRPQERYKLSYTSTTQDQFSLSGTIHPGDTLFATATVTVAAVYDGGSVRFTGAPQLPDLQRLHPAYGQVATAEQWANLNPKRLTPRKGDVWALDGGEGPEVEVEFAWGDGWVHLVYQDGSHESLHTDVWLEECQPVLRGSFQPLFTFLGLRFGLKFVSET